MPDVFTSSTLALPRARESMREASQLGVLVSVRLLRQASALPLSAGAWSTVFELSRRFVVTNTGAEAGDDQDDSQPRLAEATQGILSLAWASLLAHQYQEHRPSVPDTSRLEGLLQESLATAERMHGFYHLNLLLRTLVFGDDSQEGESVYPFLHPCVMDGNSIWQLPPVSGLRSMSKKHRKKETLEPLGAQGYRVAVFQHVGADFLNDVLGSLGYLDGAADLHQINAMVKLASPVLANPEVAEQALFSASDDHGGAGNGLAVLVQKAQDLLPHSPLPCLRLFTAFCSNVDARSPSPLLRQVLKDFAKPLSREKRSVVTPRLLPPDEFLEVADGNSGTVKCARSFYYEDDQLSIPAGTTGRLVDASAGDGKLVQWHLEHSGEQQDFPLSLWDSVFETMEAFVAQVQGGSLLHASAYEDMEALTSFFEWIVQASRQTEKGRAVLDEIGCRWTEARLRRWWLERRLPSPQDVLPLLFSQQVSLSVLQDASREDLVAWGIRDRYIREQVLVQLVSYTSANSSLRTHQHGAGGRSGALFESDGFTHLIRIMFGFLDGFVHERRTDDDVTWSSKQLHFVSAAMSALSALTSLDSCVSIIIEELSGGTEECVNLILKSSRKIFEYHERLAGDYPVVASTLDIAMNLVRWFLSREARAVDQGSPSSSHIGSREFASAERNWFVGAVEFAVEILSTHESWKFQKIVSRWELTNRCFRVIFALLSAKFAPEENSMLHGLQAALRKTMVTDVTLMMKLLRSTCGVVSIRQHQLKSWNSINVSESELDGEDFIVPQPISRNSPPDSSTRKDVGLYPLTFETESNSPVETERLESLVVASLRLIYLLIDSEDSSSIVTDYKSSAALLLTSIDDGGPKARKPLNLITLCGGYLAYPMQKRREIVFWSLKILKHASVFLERSGSSSSSSSRHTLGALFQGKEDIELVRDAMLRLLRTSLDEIMIGKELLALLTTCLEHQPGFLAFLLFDIENDSDSDKKKPVKTQRLVAMIERFLVASEQLMEEATDLFCEVLNFLLQVWKGATRHGLAIHMQIVDGLRSSSNFWQNLTRALKIRMSLDIDYDYAAMDGLGQAGANDRAVESAYIGRSSPFGYLARGYILQIVSYEWHYRGSKLGDHPLTQVLETFRTEELYSHWLRTFTRLDYAQSRFAEVCARVQQYSKQPQDLIGEMDVRTDVPSYVEGLICDTAVLQWQLRFTSLNGQGSAVLQRAKWCNLQGAYVQAQCFSLSRWKIFMELCCFQPGGVEDASAAEPTSSETTQAPAPMNRFKRKESMIASPPRLSTKRAVPPSPLEVDAGAKPSSFSGDRTSFGMIQVLSDIIFARQKNEADSSLDYFGLEHLHLIVELLVSMLHHQLCQVVQKTRDPKFSQTRQRQQRTQSRLTVQKSLSLLRLVEKTAQNVELSLAKNKSDFDVESLMDSGVGDAAGKQSLWKRLAGDFITKIDAIGVKLRTSLLTASLLLVRHIVAVHADGNRASESRIDDPQDSSILQVKLVHHCMSSIKLCDKHQDSPALRELFQVSWCLFQEILDGFVHITATAALGQRVRLDSFVTLRPLLTLLEHEQNGLAALFEVLIQRFRVKKSVGEDTRVDRRGTQEQALIVLSGLTTVIWNAKNRDICRRIMVNSATSELRLLPLLATRLIPLLRAQMEQEDAATGLHGYMLTEEGALERSVAHRMWCALLGFAAGLLKLLSPADQTRFGDPSDNAVWEFLAHGEPLMLAALRPEARLTRARIDEQEAILRFLNAVSSVDDKKHQWKQGLPHNFALLMEQSRLLLRRSCVLLGSSHSETKKIRQKKSVSKTVAGLATSPLAAARASLSSFSFSHQTLLHEHLHAVRTDEKRHLTEFYRSTEVRLAEIARQSSSLLLKWTAGLTSQDSIAVVNGVRLIDEEKLVPLLTFTAPNRAMSMSCDPCLGHLCIAMDFLVDQLEHDQRHGDATAAVVFGNTVDICALLFLKTYLLHSEQFESPKSEVDDTHDFFQRLNERVSKGGSELQSHVDQKLLQIIEQVCRVTLLL